MQWRKAGWQMVPMQELWLLLWHTLNRRQWLKRNVPRWYSIAACLMLAALLFTALVAVRNVQAQPAIPLVRASASCATLAGVDRTATNGADWGRTILAGHGAPGGWFGVDVCANGNPAVNGDSSSVSCDRWPGNWNRSGCAPGSPTSDGYGWTFQCPELVVRFSAWAFGDNPGDWGRTGWGNAPDLWVPANHPADFVMYPNGSTHAPVPGDILIWGSVNSKGQPWPAGPDGAHGGHIAVVAAVTNGVVVTAEQNVKWGAQDHPSDRLALTQVGGRWILSGTQAHETQVPAYRWPRTMGSSRATYGWLHSVRNTGHFPSSARTVSAPARGTGTTVPHQPSGGFPSLESATVVTSNGQLADLVWSNGSIFDPKSNADGPSAAVRSLGAPTGTRLVAGQRPATIAQADGSRISYVNAVDGHVYMAQVVPATFGVFWSDLGHPTEVMLHGSVAASSYAGGLGVVALGSDGNLWWRTGPGSNVGSWGAWQQIARLPNTQLTDNFVFAGSPGQGTPLILALGANGQLYEQVWMDSQYGSDGSVAASAGWSDWQVVKAQPANVQFTGTLGAVAEAVQTHNYIGTWPDSPLDIAVLDTQGQFWWLRTATVQTGWQIAHVTTPVSLTALLGGALVDSTPTKAQPAQKTQVLHFYTTAAGGSDLLSLPLPVQGTALPTAGTWARLKALPANVSANVGGAIVPLATNASIIVVASGNEVMIGGSANSTATLLPGVTQTTTPDWLLVGSLLTAPAFNDQMGAAALNPQWAVAGSNTRVVINSAGARLIPASGGVAALLQGADPGAFVLAVHMTLPAKSRAKAGLVLYLDDSDWVTLLADSAGHIALCGMAWQSATPCTTTRFKTSTLALGFWLQLARQGDTFAATVSLDDTTWTTVGNWAPPHTDASVTGWNSTPTVAPTPVRRAGAAPTGTANTTTPGTAPVASLAFTSWGIMSVGSFSADHAPLFSDFMITSAG